MTDRNETLADIAEAIRKMARDMEENADWENDVIVVDHTLVEGFNNLADRIEAAWKGERRILVAEAENAKDARNRMGIKLRQEFAGKCKECAAKVGNAAKLRDALQMFVDSVEWLCDGDKSGRIKRQFAVLLSDARAALAAPPRNCDVGTAEWQGTRLLANFEQWRKMAVGKRIVDAVLIWAQLPYEAPAAQEGGDHAEA